MQEHANLSDLQQAFANGPKGASPKQLEALKRQIPYKWKVQTAKQWGCECVAYVDARQVMDLLDEVLTPAGWQDSYREVAGNVYCDLSILVNGEWVTKSDCGSESNFEREKGQASDAFKRAAVKWGIGRFLYTLDTVRLKSIEGGNGKFNPADDNGRRIYNLTAFIRAMQNTDNAATATQKEDIQDLCKQKGLSSQQLKSYLKRKETSWKKLTQKQAAQLLTDLEQRPTPTAKLSDELKESLLSLADQLCWEVSELDAMSRDRYGAENIDTLSMKDAEAFEVWLNEKLAAKASAEQAKHDARAQALA